MRKLYKTLFACIAALVTVSSVVFVNAKAGGHYEVFVDDQACLFTDDEIDELLEEMDPITEYGNVGVITIDMNAYSSTADFATDYIDYYYGMYSDSVVFVIDMDNRWLDVTSEGNLMDSITPTKADIITDNIYHYAEDGDYFRCAKRAVNLIYDVLAGNKIAQPMKYLSNGCVAILLSLIIGYIVARSASSTAKASDSQKLANIFTQFKVRNPKATYTGETKEYSPRSSSSGGGGGGGGGGGHSSSGGHGF